NRLDRAIGQQTVREVAPDEARAANQEITSGHRVRLDCFPGRQTANVFKPNLCAKQRMLLGMNPARTSSGQKSRTSEYALWSSISALGLSPSRKAEYSRNRLPRHEGTLKRQTPSGRTMR